MKRIKNSADYLLENGLIFEINRKILHPLGLALEVDIEYGSRDKIVFQDLISTNDKEGILYSEEAYKIGEEKYDEYMESVGAKKIGNRLKELGFIIQKIDDK